MNELTRKTKEFFIKNGCFKAVVGLSGGVDSAVVLKVLAGALGNENVTALVMPEKGLSEHTEDATELARSLRVGLKVIEINKFLECFKEMGWQQNRISEMNIKARIRGALLYNYANAHGAMVAGTSNKSELLLGYGTKHGDLACDVYVIGNLYKTEVYELAKELDVPQKFISKTPTAELYAGQTDENELGASYEELDRILKAIAGREDLERFDKMLVSSVLHRIKQNEHKRKMPEVIK